MQIRLTVVDPLAPSAEAAPGRAPSCDVLVTAPAGTALAAITSALASAVTGDGAPTGGSGQPALYVGAERLDAQRCTLGEPPLTDGAVLALGAPTDPEPHPEVDDAPTRLDVVAGPDAGGVHLLHGGRIEIGRSADADVPLDDPDVSRLHCAVTVGADGRVSVADLDSTNGTVLDGTRVGPRPVRFPPGALLRIGESALRLAPAGGPGTRMPTAPDGEGHVRVTAPARTDATPPGGPLGPTRHAYGTADLPPARRQPAVPEQGQAPRIESRGARPYEARGAVSRRRVSGVAGAPGVVSGGTYAGDGGETHAGRLGATGSTGGAPMGTEGQRKGAAPDGLLGGLTGPRAHSGDAATTNRPLGGQPGGAAPDQPLGGSAGPRAHSGDAATTNRPLGDATGPGGQPGGAAPDRPLGGSAGPRAGDAATANRPSGTSTDPGGRTGPRAHSGDATTANRPLGKTTGPGGHPGDAATTNRPSGTSTTPGGHPAGAAPDRPLDGSTGPRAHSGDATTTNRPLGGSTTPGGHPGGAAPGRPLGGPAAPAHDSGTAAPRTPAPAGTPAPGEHAAHATPSPGGPAATDEHARATDPEAGSRRTGTPPRGTDVPQGARKRGGLGAWARRLTGNRGEPSQAAESEAYDEEAPRPTPAPASPAPQQPETWPDPAALLLTALGPGPRLWERGPDHPEALTVRLGTADRAAPDGSGLLPAVPVTADLREVGALGLAGPRARLAGLARAVVAQLAALHSPDTLEIVLLSADRARPLQERTAEWSWLGWLPHLRPGHGQDCRLLLAYDREQATARTDELLRRLEETPQPTTGGTPGTPRRPSWAHDDAAAPGFDGPYTVLLVDGDPGGAGVREAVARLALEGPRAGIHVVCLAESPPASPASPVTETYEAACAAAPTFRECGAVALLSGDVATALRLMRVARSGVHGTDSTLVPDAGDRRRPAAETPGGHSAPPRAHTTGPVGHGTVAAVDAVSPAWAERFARALAPLRTDGAGGERQPRVSAPLPQMARLLDELGLARATPASLMTRWADAADDTEALGGRAWAVLGAGPRGPVCADLVADGPHLLIEGPAGSGRTELLRAVVASLAAAERPDRLSIVLMDGRDSVGAGSGGQGEGLRVCTDVPHVTTHLTANDPVRMREFAQSLSAELKRRGELLGRSDFAEWHTGRELSGRMVAQRGASGGAGDLETPPSSTIRLRPAAARRQAEPAPPLPRLVVVVDDLDALVSPALGSPGRPSAGSVMRALEAVAREGERLGVHLVAAAASGGRTAESEAARRAALRVTLDAPAPGPDEPAPGRGRLTWADGRTTAFQGGRVTGRIPRTATLRPTVVALDWHRMGDPPARRPVRELGNGPTDLALLASALERAAREVAATEVPSLL
ncbi:FHA domain-containing protein [Streptomyces sp. NPDC020489]|uniref:FHA domain-containing protein n=1 Tax=Streptomyces sp. NPDC020489 TaxID=3365077 RepID=UPI0037BDBDB0